MVVAPQIIDVERDGKGESALSRRWRCQPPVHSPLSVGAIVRSARATQRDSESQLQLADLLARRYAADGVLLTDSGTSALRLALAATIVETRCDVVALPAYCCYDLATAAVGANARVTFYDIDSADLSPDLASLERALEAGARSVVVAPLYGVPVAWDQVATLAERYDAAVVEDAAQGHGAEWNGHRVGALGSLSVLSFGRGKGWTGGGGGALLWRGRSAPVDGVGPGRRGAGARAFTGAFMQWAFARPTLYGVPSAFPWLGLGETAYKAPAPPAGITAVQAALALATHAAAEAEVESRRTRAAVLMERLPDTVRQVRTDPSAQPGWLRLPVLVSRAASHVAAELRPLGVAAGYPATLPTLPALRGRMLDSPTREFSGASSLVRDLVTLPTHGHLRSDETDLLVRYLQRR